MSNLKLQIIIDQFPEHEFIVIDGHDNAIVGVSTDMRLVYCEDTIIENLMAEMSEEDAVDFYEYNIAASYIADNQPIIFKKI
jgi:rubrerythrin